VGRLRFNGGAGAGVVEVTTVEITVVDGLGWRVVVLLLLLLLVAVERRLLLLLFVVEGLEGMLWVGMFSLFLVVLLF